MTISSTTQKVTGNGNGSATTFSFSPMIIFDTDQVEVTLVAADGTETLLVLGTGPTKYAVTPASGTYPSSEGVSGSVVYPEDEVTPIASGVSLVIKRKVDILQATDLGNQGGYFSAVQEATFDYSRIVDLQQQEELDRRLKVPISDTVVDLTIPTVADRASKTFIWDSSGLPTAGAATTSTISGAMDPVVTAATTQAGLLQLILTNSVEFVEGADVASDTTTEIWDPQDGNTVHVTGTTTITSLGTAAVAGAWRLVIFDGALTLTHGASLILPGAANIATAAGDMALVYADSTSINRVAYWPADGKQIVDVDVADLADGTDGELITWDTSGVPATVAVGTATHILTSNGAGAAPTFQAPASTIAFTQSGAIATTSGTTVSLASGLSGVNEVEIVLDGVSTNTANQALMLQLGDSGGFETSGYSGAGVTHVGSGTLRSANSAGFFTSDEGSQDASTTWTGTIVLRHMGSNIWAYMAQGDINISNFSASGNGLKTLTGTLTQIQLTTSGGSATYDLGNAYVRYR